MGGLLYRLDLLVLLVVTGMADVVAITAYAQFWFPGLSDWVASLAVILLLLGLNRHRQDVWRNGVLVRDDQNCRHRGADRGRPVMVMMHFKSPTGVEASFAHLWNDGGWFPKGLSGFFCRLPDCGVCLRGD